MGNDYSVSDANYLRLCEQHLYTKKTTNLSVSADTCKIDDPEQYTFQITQLYGVYLIIIKLTSSTDSTSHMNINSSQRAKSRADDLTTRIQRGQRLPIKTNAQLIMDVLKAVDTGNNDSK